MKLCSACLLGVNCRYNGKGKPNEKVLRLSQSELLIPVCPEQLGGLPTPRPAAEQREGRVITVDGADVTEQFVRGAEEVARIAEAYNITEAILKQRSPSCGCGQVYDGTFSGRIVKGDGVAAALLKKKGIKVISEEEL
jgi:uncharacterized protein YbbK (DUF523 family)